MVQLPRIYLITDRQLLPPGQLLTTLEQLLDAGLQMVQLREKDLPAAELYPLAEKLRRLTKRYGCKLLINDRIDVALAVAADGVHLGGHSLPIAVARELLGPGKLLGVSTHRLPEISAAAAAGADFVTYGPVYATPSKLAYGPPLGPEKFKEACRQKHLPVYALGGVKIEHAPDLLAGGAAGLAMISALLAAPCPATAFRQLQ